MTARFAAASVIAICLVAMTYVGFVTTPVGQELEDLALRGAALRSESDRLVASERLMLISVATFAVALVAVMGVGLLRGRAQVGVAVAALMGLAVVIVEVLKEVLPRPELTDGPSWILRNSFPSGTAAVAVAIALGAMLIGPDRLRWIVVSVAVVGAAFVGQATQTSGWHRLSDTIGSSLIVVATMAAGLSVMAAFGRVQRSPHGRIDRRVRVAVLIGAGTALALAVLVLGIALIFPLLASPTGGRRVFLQTAFPLVGIGLTAVILMAFAWLIEPFTFGRNDADHAIDDVADKKEGGPVESAGD